MNICVVGTGYVGLVVGCCLAGSGNRVVCTDTDGGKIAKLNQGILPIFEPGLGEMLRANERTSRLEFSTDVAGGIRGADIVLIAVGTPPGEDGSADLQHVLDVARTIAENLNDYKVIVCKSTVPVGTCDKVRAVIASRSEVECDVVSNPEFLKEGHAVEDFLRPDRIIIGTDSERARHVMAQLYAAFQRTSDRLLFMDVRSAEMTKYAANAMLATRISFMNEIAGLCDAVGADVERVRRGVGSDPRIGNKFIFPGVGFGGSCFPKDLRALISTGAQNGHRLRILESVVDVNDRQKRLLVDKLAAHFGDQLAGKTVAMWGVSFKPRTDDVREAPALEIMGRLLGMGVRVRASDPVALDSARTLLGDSLVELIDNEYEALEGADALMVVTEWAQYRQPDFERMKALMGQPVIFDGRNIYDPRQMQSLGFDYYSVGRPTVRRSDSPAGAVAEETA